MEGKERRVSLLCALVGSISLGRGCPGTTLVWAVAQLCQCAHTPLCPQQCQRLTRDPRLVSPWPQQQAGADGSGGNITGIPAHLSISLAGLGHQHSLREYETCVRSSAETRTTTWARRGGLPCAWHTPAAAGYLAASTQAGSCGRLGAKAGLPPGIVPRPQLGRIIKDSSPRETRWGGSLYPVGVPSLGDRSPAARETLRLCCPQVGAGGAHRCVFWGHGGHGPLGWCCLAQARLVGAGYLSLGVPHSHRGDCAGPGLDRGNWHSAGARLAQGNTRPPGRAASCNGPPIQHICWHCQQSSPAQPPAPPAPCSRWDLPSFK